MKFSLPASRSFADAIAGLSIAGLLLPEAVAYSGIAGLPPQAGVIALFAGLIFYGFTGTSRFAVVSATSSSAAVLLAATSAIAGLDVVHRMALAGGLITLTGALFVVAGLAGLGSMSSFIAKPVLRGFAFALAATIVLHQLPKILVVQPMHSGFFRYGWELIAAAPHWNRAGCLLAIVAFLLLKLLARWPVVPGAFLLIAAGIGLDIAGFTADYGLQPVGRIGLTLNAPVLPQLAGSEWLRLGELAFAMVLILYAESYASIRTFAIRHGDTPSPNRDLLGLGLANIVSGLFQGMPVGAGYSATSANDAAGAQSQWAVRIAAGVVLVLVITLLPWISRTPEFILAVIVIHAVSHTLDPSLLRQYFLWRRDRIILLSAMAAVFLFGVLDGLLAGIAVSLLLMLRSFAEPRVSWLGRLGETHDYIEIARHPEARPVPEILIARPELPLFFANAERMLGVIRARVDNFATLKAIIISLEESPDLDSTTIEALREFAQMLEKRGITLRFARAKDTVRDVIAQTRVPELLPVAFSAWSVADAVRAVGSAEPT